MKITEEDYQDFIEQRASIYNALEAYFIEYAEEVGFSSPEKYDVTQVYSDSVDFEWEDHYWGQPDLHYQNMPLTFIFDREKWRKDFEEEKRKEEERKQLDESRKSEIDKSQMKKLMEKYPEAALDILKDMEKD